MIFQLLGGVPLGARAGVRVDFERGVQVRMSKLTSSNTQTTMWRHHDDLCESQSRLAT